MKYEEKLREAVRMAFQRIDANTSPDEESRIIREEIRNALGVSRCNTKQIFDFHRLYDEMTDELTRLLDQAECSDRIGEDLYFGAALSQVEEMEIGTPGELQAVGSGERF